MRSTGYRRWGSCTIVVLLLSMLGAGAILGAEALEQDEILTLSLEDLLNVQVTSVSKHAQPLSDAAAAIYVVTADDIRRSGATSIPDALRMVPGLHVGRIDGSKWAVTARGFNGRFSTKLLVLIDGRSVYTPLFSGVYWEVQDVLLADIDRIEIIRGPGSTLWGANAVNGVINIITKHAADTQGGYLTTAVGSEERGIAGLRYGTELGDGTFLRVFTKAFDRDGFVHPDGSDAHDGWSMLRGGFRLDSQRDARDAFTLQGDVYDGDIDQEVLVNHVTPPYRTRELDAATVFGWNVLGRWQRTISPTSKFTIQAYFNRYDRDEFFEHETTDEADLEVQHGFAAGPHDFVWGLNYRHTRCNLRDLVGGSAPWTLRTSNLYSGFCQDQVDVVPERLTLTLGAKLEHNLFTAYEFQPSARLLWRVRSDHRLWAAASRAVRTPSYLEREIKFSMLVLEPFTPTNPSPFPINTYVQGTDAFVSEELMAYELGYRYACENLSLDLALFLHDYDHLRASGDIRVTVMPTYAEAVQDLLANSPDRTHGGELAAVWRVNPRWRWDIAYTYYKRDFKILLTNPISAPESAPRHQVSLRSSWQPNPVASVDLWLRYVGDYRALIISVEDSYDIPAYISLDARLGFRLSRDVDLSFVGQNLLDDQRFEYGQEVFTNPSDIQRGFYVGLDWRF